MTRPRQHHSMTKEDAMHHDFDSMTDEEIDFVIRAVDESLAQVQAEMG